MTFPATQRRIRGAVLNLSRGARPYAQSRPISIVDLSLGVPGPDEVVVRIEASGICHSDLAVVNGRRPRPLPMLLGHESAGIVEEVGHGVDDLQVGQRVVMTFLPRCGDCAGCRSNGRRPCIAGSKANSAGTLLSGERRITQDGRAVNHHLGVSGFATHAVVSRHSVVPVGTDVPPAVAALLGCAMLTGGGAVLNVVEPEPRTTLAIVGLGGVGMAALITARALGVETIIGIDSESTKFSMARKLGASATLSPQDALAKAARYGAVIEAAGHPRALETAIGLTAEGGTTVTVGLPAPGHTVGVDPLALTSEARSIVGSYLGSSVPEVDIPIYERLWREGKLAVDALISDTITLDDVNEAMDKLAGGRALRQIISFDEEETNV